MSARKACTKCRRDLPATTVYFHKKPIAKDGLSPWCKTCHMKDKKSRETPVKPVRWASWEIDT